MMENTILEWAPFNLREGVDETELLAASAELQAGFLMVQPGFIRRELVRQADGSFADLVWWQSRDAAEAAIRAAESSATCRKYFAIMAMPQPQPGGSEAGHGVQHFASLAVYPSGYPSGTMGLA